VLFDDLVSDYKSQQILQKYLREVYKSQFMLKNITRCGETAIPIPCEKAPAVHVVRKVKVGDDSDVSADYRGVLFCHSSWSCPRCTPRVMAEYGKFIASSIDALDARNQSAAMITFTIPHNRRQSAYETFEILQNTWRMFAKNKAGKLFRQHTLASGETTTYAITKGAYGEFRERYQNQHFVRVYEFTWGQQNGWHPHIHALYWFSNDKFNGIVEMEKTLADYWRHCAKFQTKKFYMQQKDWRFNNDENEVLKFVDDIFAASEGIEHEKRHCQGLFISKNLDGTPRKINSSMYIAKWSAGDEMTNQHVKTAQPGHYNPFQLIDEAKKADSWEEACKWLKLFVTYAETTLGHRRYQLSNSGLRKITEAWIAEHGSTLCTKKKGTPIVERTEETVFTFTSESWWLLSQFNKKHPEEEIFIKILKKARAPDATAQIRKLLDEYGFTIMAKTEFAA